MRGAEGVVLALRALGEPRQPASLTQGTDSLAPAGQDLVRVALMPDIPHQDVVRGVEKVVKRNRELDYANSGPQMAPGVGDRIDCLGAELVGKHLELPHRHPAQVAGPFDAIQVRSFDGHGRSPSALTRQNVLSEGP